MTDNNTFYPQLYSKDRKGKVRIWNIIVQDNIFTVTYGLEFGKQQIKQTVCKGKNIGKSNETTPAEQAILEATSKHKFQIQREDYALTPEESNLQVRPQLALDATKVGHRVDWDHGYVTLQPKIDGLRLTYGKRWFERDCEIEFMSRKGDTYDVDHLTEACNALLDQLHNGNGIKDVSLDGELYIHGLKLQQIVSRAKKYKKGLTEELKYYLFDLVIPDIEFCERYEFLENALFNMPDEYKEFFVLVENDDAKNKADLERIHKGYLQAGFEGTIIRHPYAMYAMGERSPHLFKYKEFQDTEVKILEVWEDKNQNAMLTCQLKNGLICKVTPKRTHAFRKQMLIDADDYIGKWITVKYFDTTGDGNLQFPIGLDLRECNEFGEPIE